MSKNEIKYYSKLKQKKYRESEGSFLIEGKNLIEECLKSQVYCRLLDKIFVRNDYSGTEFLSSVSRSNPHIEIIKTDSSGINSLSETVNSQGIIGVVKKPVDSFSDVAGNKSHLVVLLESINDPGNLGTILRTCHWYGVNKVYISKDSVDFYNSKVLRSSQGAIFHLNIGSDADAESLADLYYRERFQIILTDLKADEYVSDLNFDKSAKYLVVFGNESGGISDKILENKNYMRVKIKGYTECESLNLAVSAGILLDRIKNN